MYHSLSKSFEDKIYKMYSDGYTINDIIRRFKCSGQEAVDIIGERTKQLKKEKELSEQSKLNVCSHCRWRPCNGAPSCYRKTIDKNRDK